MVRVATNIIHLAILACIIINSVSIAQAIEDDLNFEIDTVITPTRTETPIIDSPVSMTRLDLNTISYLGLKEFDEILRLVPGFLVTQYQGHSPQISYHGTQGSIPRRMEVLLDGQSIYRSGYARVNWGRLPVSEQDLNYIEVARGPSVSDYGSNSFLSAVNLISRKPQDEYGNFFELRAGSHDTIDTFARKGYGEDNSFSTIRFFREANEGFDIDANRDSVDDGKVNSSIFWHTRNESGSGDFETKFILSTTTYEINVGEADVILNDVDSEELNLNVSTKHTKPIGSGSDTIEFTLNLSHYQNEQEFDRCLWAGLFLDELKQLDQSPNIDLTPETILALGGLLPQLTPDVLGNPAALQQLMTSTGLPVDVSELELTDYLAFADLASRMAEEGESILDPICGITNQDVSETSAELDFLIKLAGSKWINTFGMGFRASHVESETYLGEAIDSNTLMLSNHIRYDLSDKYVLNAGFMFESIDMDDYAFSPRASITFKPLVNHGFRLGVSQAKRSPDIYETNRHWVETYRFYGSYADLDGRKESSLYKTSRSNSELSPEEIIEYDIGYFAKLRTIPLTYDIKVFKSELKNLISEPIVYYDFKLTNESELDLAGVESQLEYKSDSITIGAIYSYLDSSTEQSFEETLYAKHAGSVYSIYSLPNNYHIGIAHYSNSKLATVSYDRTDFTVTKDLLYPSARARLQANLRYLNGPVAHYAEGTSDAVVTREYKDAISVYLSVSTHFN